MNKIKIGRTKQSNKPAFWVGGGATTNNGSAVFVVDSKYNLKEAIFIKTKGDLCNSYQQALVPIEVGDFIVHLSHKRNISYEAYQAQELEFYVEEIRKIDIFSEEDTAEVIAIASDFFNLPKKALEGSNIYHNRDGSYFCKKIIKSKNKK